MHTASLFANVQQDLEILFASTSESILLIEANGSILAANNISALWLNRSAESLSGENLFQLLTPSGIPIREWVHKAVSKNSIFESEAQFYERFIHVRLIPITEGDKVLRMIIIGRDVTEQKRVEDQVREYTEQMEQKVRERTVQLEALNKKLTDDRQRAELLASLSQHLIQDTRDYNHLLDQITQEISKLVGDICLIALFASDLTTIEILAIADRDVEAMQRQRELLLNREIFVGTNIIITRILRRRIGQGDAFEKKAPLLVRNLTF